MHCRGSAKRRCIVVATAAAGGTWACRLFQRARAAFIRPALQRVRLTTYTTIATAVNVVARKVPVSMSMGLLLGQCLIGLRVMGSSVAALDSASFQGAGQRAQP